MGFNLILERIYNVSIDFIESCVASVIPALTVDADAWCKRD